MTELLKLIRTEILEKGPMRLDRYMELCLSHPEFGYYMNRDPLGSLGDFTTAPEISQIFGELIGLWLAQAWIDMGQPNPINLVELGPGRGTLMSDILRVSNAVNGLPEALQVTLVETSPELRSKQRALLGAASWVESVGNLPDGPILFVANEFFDALPVRQFQKIGDMWVERVVVIAQDQLVVGQQKTDFKMLPSHLPDGIIVERSEAAIAIAKKLGEKLKKPCAGLIIDYGDENGTGETLQAVKQHKFINILDHPGECDLTAHVDFGALKVTFPDKFETEMTTQGDFLRNIGIHERAEALSSGKSAIVQEEIRAAVHRLTADDEMGRLFKVMAVHNGLFQKPAGFPHDTKADSRRKSL